MGTGAPQNFDIQNFFKSSSPSPASSTGSPYHPYPFPPQSTYPPPVSSSPAPSFPFPAPYSFMHYPAQDARPAPPFIQPQAPFSQSIVSPLPQQSSSQPSVSSPPLDGARLMALLTTQSTGDLRSEAPLLSHPSSLELPPAAVTTTTTVTSSSSSNTAPSAIETSEAPPAIAPALPSAPPVSSLAPQSRISGKAAKGRFLSGERAVYDIDNRGDTEEQPQLEVSTITVYSSEPALVVGRQIAVNKSYICYGLRAGKIRILNINTGTRNLFAGHTQRVLDMTFLSSDTHVLASSSIEGRVFARRIVEDVGEDGKNLPTEQILAAIHFVGDWESAQPRVCWHSRQDFLIVGIGKYVLTIDLSRFRNTTFSAEEPIQCNVKTPIDGVRVVGNHEDEVTGLAVYPGSHRFASSSKDGTVRIWGDNQPIVLNPHGTLTVNSVAFLSSPRRQDQVVLLTAGPLNKDLKLWAPIDAVNWKCIQTLELKSSLEKKVEEAFFNQMIIVPRANLILLANAKRNAIYAIHVEMGTTASLARMDYLAEFSVKMPILSFTATSDSQLDGDGAMQVYCVQTQAIQQYSLSLFMCLPPAEGKPDSVLDSGFSASIQATSPMHTPKPSIDKDFAATTTEKGKGHVDSKPKDSYSQVAAAVPSDADQIDKAVLSDAVLDVTEPAKRSEEIDEKEDKKEGVKPSKQPHLITPSELMSMVARSKTEVPLKAGTTGDEEFDARAGGDDEGTYEARVSTARGFIENTDEIIDALESGNPELEAEADALIQKFSQPSMQPSFSERTDEAELPDGRSVGMPVEDLGDLKEVSKISEGNAASASQSPAVLKGKKNKNKAVAPAVQVPSSSAVLPEAETNGISPSDSLQDTLNQLLAMHKDLQKQLSVMITVPMTKEVKRMETSLGQRLEKILKANVDAMYAKLQEESVKREKAERERSQQLTTTLTNCINSTKEVPTAMERILKKELAAVGPAVAKLLSQSVEKAIATALAESSQNLSEKAVANVEKAVTTKLDASVARHLQSQFQTTAKQALQDAMRTCFEGSVVPSFERSCRAMFEQVDGAFQKGMAEHTSHAQQQASASHNALASSLQDSVNSLAQTLKSELADGQRKLAALAETRYQFPLKQASGTLPDKVLSLQHVEETLDPTKELSRLLSQGKLEEAFNKALSLSDVSVVSWLCNQVDPATVFSSATPPLSQGVLLSLVQQLGCDLGKDTARKLTWIQGASVALNPSDPVLAPHMRAFLDQLYQNLHRQVMITPATGELANSLRLVIHVVNSLLSSCK
ncbi:enhancer of mRNA-decapping protein 4-like isoform X1 [Selaginella moellendorffii]|uniref:enhancer of mRNA-decapping protein 4-like isoform X1 n=1 Tax=Selaginella moellendorffii TaxID=88036 RepID=UPI000D1C2455|nr:enhancer of mRNA-decapping protein 4-like isoform X1 [Selaginella moellendorffii]|eukprot:XP_024516677.1 enhancer of mRNA-decapping protein 4-like isoform X1 [Selaginella moellendorffii]